MPDIDEQDHEMLRRLVQELDANTHPKQALMEEEMSSKLKRAEQQAPESKKMQSITEKLKAAWIEREKTSEPKP